ncbi:MAG: formate dehydrogenase, alpha subunit, partial [Phenylobacterium sp.]|nr:formate dehydrogenase, alpha subunit [Phenylobacterium sp.]
SFQKAIYGDAARADNDWAYDWLPKVDGGGYDIIRAFEMMSNGQMNGYICQGFNPLQAFPDRGKITKGLSKLKYLVVMDPLDTETSRFWENHGPQNPSDPAKSRPKSFSCRRPASRRKAARW